MRHLLYFILTRLLTLLPGVKRFLSTPGLFRIRGGFLKGWSLYMAPIHGFTKIFGRYESEVSEFMARTIRAGDHCVDGGCHVGYFTLLMAKAAGPKGGVLAVDPSPVIRRFMEKTLSVSSGTGDVRFFHGGLGERPGSMETGDEGAVNMVNLDKAKGGERVRIVTLDSLCRTLKWKRLDFIKLDVEGFEYRVLLGGRKSLAAWHPTLLIEVHSQFDAELGVRIGALLTGLGYELSTLDGSPLDEGRRRTLRDQRQTYYMVAKWTPAEQGAKQPKTSRAGRKPKTTPKKISKKRN